MMNVKLFICVSSIIILQAIELLGVQTKSINYSVEHGLSQSTVTAIIQDDFGQMWFGTRNGLNLFNGYEFEVFLHSTSDSNSIINNEITTLFQLDSSNLLIGTRNGLCKLNILTKKSKSYDFRKLGYEEFVVNKILKDHKGRLWVGTREGIFLYNTEIDNFETYEDIDHSTGSVNTLVQDATNNIWLGTNNGIFSLDDDNVWRIQTNILYNPNENKKNWIMCISFDRYNNFWVGTRNNGLYSINQDKNNKLKHFTQRDIPGTKLTSDEIRDIIEDRKGRIWIGTKEGVNIFDPFTGKIEAKQAKIGIINTISQNSTYSLYEDTEGGIWVGTWSGGINLLETDYNGFLPVTQFQDGENSGPLGAVSSIVELNNKLWIGTENNGIIVMDRDWNTLKTLNTKNTGGRLRSNHIKKLFKDHLGNIWIGFYDRGIQVFNPKSGKIIDKIDLINVYDIEEYPKRVYWIGSRRQFIKLDERVGSTKTIEYQGEQESTNIQAGSILYLGSNNLLWTGSRFGIDAYSLKTDSLIQHFDLTDIPMSRNEVNIFSLSEDSSETLWIGTNQGLFYLNQNSNSEIKTASEELKKYIIYSIIPEGEDLWLSTNDGIIFFSPESRTIKRFTLIDGLQSNEFIQSSFYQWSDNYLFFGGINGFNAFTPKINIKKRSNPKIIISKIEFAGKVGKYISEIFYPAKTSGGHVVLPPNQPKITIHFVSLDYFNSSNISYSYRLDGFSEEWRRINMQRSVGFTNLQPGEYTFRVRTEEDGISLQGDEVTVQFKIRRAFYATFPAFFIYIILIAAIIYWLWKFISQKRRIQHELNLQKLEHEQLNQLNDLKTKFFMNVSHEFRTPLTVIHGPVERMLESDDYTLSKEEASTILRNTNRLISLLDQLLEFRKIEKGKTKMKVEHIDLSLFTKDVLQLFRTIAHEKNILIEFIGSGSIFLWADRDKMEKILSNLLSNAIKFTPDQGKILIEITENQDPINDDGNIELSVIDNGIGMSTEEINRIFDRFETLGDSDQNPKGIGIGLSLTKELVKLHHGSIKVDSQLSKGSAFTIVLPKGRKHYSKAGGVEIIEESKVSENTDTQASEKPERSKEKASILIVDDNRDIRKYISGILSAYNLFEAESVEDAEIILGGNMPDLIISDIILPGKDGYDFCKQIKNEQHTSHIPVILMTAKGNIDNRIHGLELGADAFIPKPFSERFLKVWVEKLIASRRKMFDYYMAQIMHGGKKKSEHNVSVKDSFLESARKIIEKDIANSDLSVEMLSKQMNMSRSNLHLKFKAIINQTPSDFIRIIRLNYSAELLMGGRHNIVEAAYSSGFNSPSYFTKCFKQYFKRTPTEFLEEGKSG